MSVVTWRVNFVRLPGLLNQYLFNAFSPERGINSEDKVSYPNITHTALAKYLLLLSIVTGTEK